MRILYLSHRIPYPPNKGDKLRAFNEIKFLSKNHKIDLFTLYDDLSDAKYIEHLKGFCANVEAEFIQPAIKKIFSLSTLFFSKRSCTEYYFYSRKLHEIVCRNVTEKKYDLIFLYCSSMYQYIDTRWKIPVVIDFVDVDSDKWIQYSRYASFPKNKIFKIEGGKISSLENEILKNADASFIVTQKEADFLQKSNPDSKVYAVPNGIDFDFFDSMKVPPNPELAKQDYIVFTGAMDYFPNEDGVIYFYKEIFPAIKKEFPAIKFFIVGRNPGEKVIQLSENKDVVVTGAVDDIRPYIKHAKIAVVPLRMARGIQNKILEAAAMGVAVICTSVAHEGLELIPDHEIIVEDNPAEFASQTINLLQKDSERNRIAVNALKKLHQKYDWPKNLEFMEKIIAYAHGSKIGYAEGGI